MNRTKDSYLKSPPHSSKEAHPSSKRSSVTNSQPQKILDQLYPLLNYNYDKNTTKSAISGGTWIYNFKYTQYINSDSQFRGRTWTQKTDECKSTKIE